MDIVTLKHGHDRRVRAGHPWIFSNEIAGDVRGLPPGGDVEVRTADGRFVGRGYANPASLIGVRLLTREATDDIADPGFFAARITSAAALRARVLPGRRSCRVVAGEADGLPGLVVDRFDDVLAVQILTLGMERRLPALESALRAALEPRGAVLRNDAAVRKLEGLDLDRRVWWGDVPERVPFEVDGTLLVADVLEGQKTGFFFDQAANRAFAAGVCAGLDVIDVYANTGAWAIGALRAGARSAVAVEVNEKTCALLSESAGRNGVADRLVVAAAEAKADMSARVARGERYGAVFLDPPAFAKSRKAAGSALRGYRDINRLALALVARGGLLFTSSCSYHVQEDRWLAEIAAAAGLARRSLRQVRRGEQAPDHPVLLSVPETRYLKHAVFIVD